MINTTETIQQINNSSQIKNDVITALKEGQTYSSFCTGEVLSHMKRVQEKIFILVGLLEANSDNFPEWEEFLTKENLNEIVKFAPLHDIGKLLLNQDTLYKTEKLSIKEKEHINLHTIHGYALLKAAQVSEIAENMALFHHTNWEKSPPEAQILSVVDCIEALTSKRSYKEVWTKDMVFNKLKATSANKFNPKLVEFILKHYDVFSFHEEESTH